MNRVTSSTYRPVVVPMAAWVGLGALLVAELLLASILFDTGALSRRGNAWLDAVVGQAGPVLVQLGTVVVAALVLFAARGHWVIAESNEMSATISGPRWWSLAAHLGSYAALLFCLDRLLNEAGTPRSDAIWFTASTVIGLATIGFWGLSAVPAANWPIVLRNIGRLLPAGLAVGGAALLAALAATQLWRFLTPATFAAVRWLLGLVFPQVIADPDQANIGTPNFVVNVAPQCSGCEGIGLVLVFLGTYLWCFRQELRFPQALLLLPLGAVVMAGANVLRIVALIAIGSWGWPDVALGGFHSQAGWMAFIAISLGLILVSRRVRLFGAVVDRREETAVPMHPAAPWLVPMLLLVALAMVTGVFTSGFDALYPLRVGLVGVVMLAYRRHYYLNWGWSWPAIAVGFAVFGMWLALEQPNPQASETIDRALTTMSPALALGWLIARVVGSVIVVPLAEELAFRGYLLRRLSGASADPTTFVPFSWLAFIASSVFFGLLHQRWLAGILAGAAYTAIYYHRRRVGDAAFAHSLTNGLIALYVLWTSDWHLWA